MLHLARQLVHIQNSKWKIPIAKIEGPINTSKIQNKSYRIIAIFSSKLQGHWDRRQHLGIDSRLLLIRTLYVFYWCYWWFSKDKWFFLWIVSFWVLKMWIEISNVLDMTTKPCSHPPISEEEGDRFCGNCVWPTFSHCGFSCSLNEKYRQNPFWPLLGYYVVVYMYLTT